MQILNPLKKISVIGCGWLGMPLSKELKSQGFKVSGSVRDISKAELSGDIGINFFQLILSQELEILPNRNAAFWEADIFILTIPPTDSSTYTKGISKILEIIERQNRSLGIIYTSSTGVYGKAKGLVDETFPPNPDRAGAAAVLDCENLLLSKQRIFDICILRLAGLVGPGRAPGRFFAGKKNLSSGSSPVNLVQLDDCIALIVTIIKKGIKKGIYNVCADQHPCQREFYTAQAIKSGLEPPEYKEDSDETDLKIIDNSLLKKILSYEYRQPDPMEF